MMIDLLIAIAAGCASALMFASISSGVGGVVCADVMKNMKRMEFLLGGPGRGTPASPPATWIDEPGAARPTGEAEKNRR